MKMLFAFFIAVLIILIIPINQAAHHQKVTPRADKIRALMRQEAQSILERKHLVDHESFDLFNYHDLGEIFDFLDQMEIKHPNRISVETIGLSHHGNPIKLAKLSSFNIQSRKKIIFLECGIHASEWISPAFCLYVIAELLQENDGPLEHFDFYLVPLLNPDGYEYSWKHVRLWRKNRTPYECTADMLFMKFASFADFGSLMFNNDSTDCYGVDLNRNFNISFGNSRKDFIYQYEGPEPFSENETSAMKKILESLQSNGSRIISYLAIHAYSELWLLPYGFKRSKSPHYDDLLKVAKAATKALKSVHSTSYSIGTSSQLVYPVNGSSQDWVHEVLGVKYVYTLELSPHLIPGEYPDGFFLPIERIQPTLEETWSGLSGMAEAILMNNHGIMKRASILNAALTGLLFFVYKCSVNTNL